jgi:hypothetical protein
MATGIDRELVLDVEDLCVELSIGGSGCRR